MLRDIFLFFPRNLHLYLKNGSTNALYVHQGINILKAHGKSAKDSYLLKGYALNTGRAAQGMPLRVAPAKIACLDFNLQKTKMQQGVQVLVTDPRELEKIRQRLVHLFDISDLQKLFRWIMYCTVLLIKRCCEHFIVKQKQLCVLIRSLLRALRKY